jgi:hypothetical protein
MKAVACESCHVPRLHMAAQQQLDQTVVQLNGRPLIQYRGVEDGTIDYAAATYIEGYIPFVLVGQSVAGEEQLIPYNLVTRWYWVDADSGEAVSDEVLRQAWLDGDNYREDIIAAFDADGDGSLVGAELRLVNDTRIDLVRAQLKQAGVGRPEIRGEIRSYHIHHNVTHGELVSKDCSVCHPEKHAAPDRFELARYVPGNVLPEEVVGEAVLFDGKWEIDEAGKLIFTRSRGAAQSYQALKAERHSRAN